MNDKEKYTPDELRFAQHVKSQAALRGVDSVEYLKAIIATVQEAIKKHPGNERKAHEYASALLDERYPVRKEGVAV